MSISTQALQGRIAVVTGATRGAGRGIAAALGEAGATVVCTGRSSRINPIPSDYQRPETIEETADIVEKLGGRGIAIAVDHLLPSSVEQLASRLAADFGTIDILVNNIWGAELLKGGPAEWNTPIWRHDLEKGLRILKLGVETHLVTSKFLLPLLISKPGGLLVEVTDGPRDYNASTYRISVYYDLAKVAVDRLSFSQGHELAPLGCTAVSVSPGWLRSEMMLENYRVTEDNWRDALDQARKSTDLPIAPPSFGQSETPLYVGRAIAAIAADADRARWNQKSVTSGQLAKLYGFADIDGAQPDIWTQIQSESIANA